MDEKTIKQKFLELETREDVANLLGIKDRSLRFFLYKKRPENMYHTFEIPKKDGSKRIISAPNKELCEIQRKLADILSEVYDPKICAYGFISQKDFIDNAKQHLKKHLILNIDLKDFFHQIHFGRILGMLTKEPYHIGREAAITIAQIACLNGRLPQGAPSSPVITNMICVPLDNALMRLAKKNRCSYTRYADDITFSTFSKEFNETLIYTKNQTLYLGKELSRILENNSFEVNPLKISLRSNFSRQEVTGITVNKFSNVRRSYVKQLRAILHNCEKHGILYEAKKYINKGLCKNAHICSIYDDPENNQQVLDWFKSVLIGKINYIKQVKGAQSLTYLSFAKKYNNLSGDESFDLTELYRFQNTVENSVFILEYDDGEDCFQGSSFYLNNFGLFTSYHVTEKNKPFKVFPVNSYPQKEIGIVSKNTNEISSDKKIDYALYKLSFTINEDLTFKLGNSRNIKTGDQVTIIGYPNHQEGTSSYIQSCYITSKKRYMREMFYTVSGRIVHGASGGIVLNSNNEVIGIIKGGVASIAESDNNENQGFVPIHLAIDHYTKT